MVQYHFKTINRIVVASNNKLLAASIRAELRRLTDEYEAEKLLLELFNSHIK